MTDDAVNMSESQKSDFFETVGGVEGIEATLNKDEIEKLRKAVEGFVNVRLQVGIFGQTGMGKSALCNALFGSDVSMVGHGASVTRQPTPADIALGKGAGIRLWDFPGLGEDEERDKEYKTLYRKKIPEMDFVLWVLSAVDRKLALDITTYKKIVKPLSELHKIPVIFVLNKADDVHPKDWNNESNLPSESQINTLNGVLKGTMDASGVQQNGVMAKFGLEEDAICVVSASKGYGLVGLVEAIVRSLPAAKKYGVVREAKKENVSVKATQEAKEGLIETIKREVVAVLRKAAPVIVTAVAKKALDWGLKWLSRR